MITLQNECIVGLPAESWLNHPHVAAAEGINAKTGWEVKIHVDGASGAFVAPFLYPELEWDFRCKNVVSINASGHKCEHIPCAPEISGL